MGKGLGPSGGSGMHHYFGKHFARAGNFLSRSYCLQFANMIMLLKMLHNTQVIISSV